MNATLVRRRTRIGRGGVLFIVVNIMLAIGAVNGQNNLLYLLFGVGLASLLVGGIVGGTAKMGLRVSRTRVGHARAGEPVRISYRVTHQGRWLPAYGLVIEEHPTNTPSPDRPASAVASSAPARSQVRARTRGRIVAFVPAASPRDSVKADAIAWPVTRGRLALKGFTVSSSYPFGLIHKELVFEQRTDIIVEPARIQLRADIRPPRSTGQNPIRHMTNRTGGGNEFLAVREYVQGDPIRTMAWRLTARTGSPVVRVTADEQVLHARIMISPAVRSDTDSSQDGSAATRLTELDHHRCAAIASALVDRFLELGCTVELATGDESFVVRPTGDARRRAHVWLASTEFAPVRPRKMDTAGVVWVGQPPAGGESRPGRWFDPDQLAMYLLPGTPEPVVLQTSADLGAASTSVLGWRRWLPRLGITSQRKTAAPPARKYVESTPTDDLGDEPAIGPITSADA